MMQLIVLGVLPGTDIQLSFALLAYAFAVFVGALLVRSYFRTIRTIRTSRKQKDYDKSISSKRTIGNKIVNLVPHSL